MRNSLAVLCALAMTLPIAADKPLLNRLTVQATGAVSVTVPLDTAPTNPIYRAADGSWNELQVRHEDNKASFSVPADAGGRTIIILNVPEWLVLDDDAAPKVERVVVDDTPVEVAEDIDLGHRPKPPQKVTVLFHDQANPIDVGASVITIDGMPVPPNAVKVIGARNGDETRFIEVTLGDLAPEKHVLKLRVPDAAAVPHFAQVTIRFNSGPILKDGGFERLDANGKPLHWATHMWSTNEETKAELKVIEGGHSGKHCAEILGIAGGLNLLFGQPVPLSGDRTYVVKGFYQATSASGYLSMINQSKDENEQYLSSPRLKPSEEWAPFEWEFSAKPSSGYTLYLRNTGKGYVRFDDVVVEEVRAKSEDGVGE